MAVVIVDGKEVQLGNQERLNGIQAARRAGVEIPHYCWHPGLTVVASCRMCLVEAGTRNKDTGQVVMQPKLVPACQTPATDGTVFVTNSDKVKQSRAFVEECLLIDHPVDCPICDKAGECYLQDYHFEYGQKERRADIRPFTSRRREMGDTVTLFVDRCVMCTRCVRFTREIAGTAELMVIQRGSHDEIDVLPDFPLANKLSGNVVDLCPVGALGDKDFLYSQRVWFMQQHPSVCTGCATGCSIHIEENQDQVYRLKPRENPEVNQWWMCDEGRYGFHYIHSPERNVVAECYQDGRHQPVDWSLVTSELPKQLSRAGALGAWLSPFLSVEEAYLLGSWLQSLDPQVTLALGPVPTVGQDERFANGFTIHAEKCPNRRGVEEVLRHLTGTVLESGVLLDRIDQGAVRAAWISGGYPLPWISENDAARLGKLPLLVVQDLFDSPVWQRAHWRLPASTFAEREGSYVNQADRLQSVTWAIRPPAGVRTEGSLFAELQGHGSMYRPRPVLEALAAAAGYFAPAGQPVPLAGVKLDTTAGQAIPAGAT